MKLKQLMIAGALAVAASGSFAVTTIGGDFDLSDGSGGFSYTGLKAGIDEVAFQFTGLAAGTYTLDASGITTPTISLLDVKIDGSTPSSLTISNGKFSLFTVSEAYSLSSPVTLYLKYNVLEAKSSTGFAGTLTVTPVPEPETYALMLAGLGVMGFVARRRKS